jgi:galactose-1-phosphate uridylyltransferase
MPLTQLIYVSSLVDQDESQLANILESAVRHNREDEITGMLLYAGGNFLQVLEGQHEQVRKTYERICLDPRHSTIIVLSEEEVLERHFSSWSMGYRQLGSEDVAKFPQYAPYFQFGFHASQFDAKPGVALDMLELFSQNML